MNTRGFVFVPEELVTVNATGVRDVTAAWANDDGITIALLDMSNQNLTRNFRFALLAQYILHPTAYSL